LLDDDPGFLETVEDLAIEQFVAQLAVEALLWLPPVMQEGFAV
jgi:hypothetical protein